MRKRFFAFWLTFAVAMLPSFAQVRTDNSSNLSNGDTSLINQIAEQNFANPNIVLGPSFSELLKGNTVSEPNETYQGIKQFWQNDLQSKFFASVGHVISDWLNQSFIGYLSAIISTLSNVVKTFFLNPNLIQITNNTNDLSSVLKQLTDIVYGIAFDLLFLLFVIAIWHYWTRSSWQGNISSMSAVGRLICTIAMVIAWPIIYSFEIELSNEMISAIFVNSTDQFSLLDMIMASTFKASLYAGASKVITQIIPAANLSALGMASLGSFLSAISWLALCILAIIIIYQLICLIVLKAIQMALLVAQYVFAPVFLIFFATPSTERIATGYICTFVETSMWTFIWIGLLRILVVLMYANFNPCGKIITAIGILQLMMQVPQFLGRFKVSAASSFVNPAFLSSGLLKATTNHAEEAKMYGNKFVSALQSVFRKDNSQAFGSAGSTMSAKFAFGKTSEYTVPYPNKRHSYPGQPYQNQVDQNQVNRSQAYQSNGSPFVNSNKVDQPFLPTHLNSKTALPRENLSANKNTNIDKSASVEASNDSQLNRSSSGLRTHANLSQSTNPVRKRSLDEQNILDKYQINHGSNVDNSFISRSHQQAAFEMPEKAAALWDKSLFLREPNSKLDTNREHPLAVDPFRVSHYSSPCRSHFLSICRFPENASAQNGLPSTNRLGAVASKASLSEQLLGTRETAEKLGRGSGSLIINKQQFRLPGFVHFSNQENSHSATAAKLQSNKFNSYISDNYQNTKDQKILYYSSSIVPGWQRPYYRDSGIKQFLAYTKPVYSISPDLQGFSVADFRSYYS